MTDFKDYEQEIEYNAIYHYLINNEIKDFRNGFLGLHTYEQSEFFEALDDADKKKVYGLLSPEEIGDFFDSIEFNDEDDYEALFDTMDARYGAEVIGSMQHDNAVDILNILSKEKLNSFLTLMSKEDARQIRGLLNYEEDTAGGIMTTEFVSVDSLMTVREAMKHLKKEAPDSETIYYVFVVDDNNRLAGIVSLRDLIIADDDEYIGDIMVNRVVSVIVSEDQEKVAQLMRDYDFLAIPVVDYQDHLLGIITHDDIMDVIDEEASEDYSRLAGLSDDESTNHSSWTTAKQRLPWLIGLTFMGMVTATMLTNFEATLERVAILGAFIPIIGGMAGNSGTQSLAVAVRGISSGEIDEQSKLRVALREMGSGLITGFVCGVILLLIITFLYGAPVLGGIVSVSLMIAMTVATLTGTLVPLLMNKIGIDPAIASGPFITTGNDILSLLVYFSLANMFMSYLL